MPILSLEILQNLWPRTKFSPTNDQKIKRFHLNVVFIVFRATLGEFSEASDKIIEILFKKLEVFRYDLFLDIETLRHEVHFILLCRARKDFQDNFPPRLDVQGFLVDQLRHTHDNVVFDVLVVRMARILDYHRKRTQE
jgi:hypothetical protein